MNEQSVESKRAGIKSNKEIFKFQMSQDTNLLSADTEVKYLDNYFADNQLNCCLQN